MWVWLLRRRAPAPLWPGNGPLSRSLGSEARRAARRRSSTPDVRRQQKPLDDLALLEMRVDDLVDVVLVDVRVPDRLRVHHRHRSARTAVQAAGLVDAHAARSGQLLGLHALLAVVERGLGIV